MEIHLTPEQEAKVAVVAARLERDPKDLLLAAALRVAEEDEQFLAFVQEGLDQADRGEFVAEPELGVRLQRILNR